MLDLVLATPQEICLALGHRLKKQRLAQLLSQDELAARAGVSIGTIKNLEGKGQSSLATLIQIVSALGLIGQLQALFEQQARLPSISEMEKVEKAKKRLRAPKKAKP
jgi:transcriptional regulator with XRE-family HTH domain